MPISVPAIRVHQWLPAWDVVHWDKNQYRAKPAPVFYVAALPAEWLRRLSGIERRTVEGGLPRSQDLGVERRHERERSDEIRRFVEFGYPWSEMSQVKRESERYNDLRKPGWLPTAIVLNMLKQDDERRGARTVDPSDLVWVEESGAAGNGVRVMFPDGSDKPGWEPRSLHPLEVIDGQHRLFAFEDTDFGDHYQLPVVLFHGLDRSWQAYLFWTINIKPKRINPSLAFDLYPLLRSEDWLERFEGHSIYREARAQELTEGIWVHPESPWHQRINMLGESGGPRMVTQAAWVRGLMASYVKSAQGRGVSIGGLFGAPAGQDELLLPWSAAQQTAFLIVLWRKLMRAVRECHEEWAESLRRGRQLALLDPRQDPAFAGPHSLLNTDQGVRAFLQVTNDLFEVRSRDLRLDEWWFEGSSSAADVPVVSEAMRSLLAQIRIAGFMSSAAYTLSTYDWRTAEAMPESDRVAKLAFRGSGGYRELRKQLLHHLLGARGEVGEAAQAVIVLLGY